VQSSSYQNWSRPLRKSRPAEITIAHVMASSALPMFFPAIEVDGEWHGDGGIRLTAPLAPALHLGAGRLIAISTRYERSQIEGEAQSDRDYPSPAQVIGVLLSAVFLDMLDYDAMNMQRLNDLVREVPPDKRAGLRHAALLLLRPSQEISKLATQYEPTLPPLFRFMMRGMGTRETKTPDSLSMVLFQPEYVRRLIQVGETDAWSRREDIEAFVQGEDRPAIARTGFWRI
jgi:NTE family protein